MMTNTIPNEDLNELRQMSKAELAASIAAMVREALLPEEGWTIEAGRDCVEVLLIAARIAYPTTADIESLGQPTTQATVTQSVSVVGGQLAEELENDLARQTIDG
jgi:hypothetical protein